MNQVKKIIFLLLLTNSINLIISNNIPLKNIINRKIKTSNIIALSLFATWTISSFLAEKTGIIPNDKKLFDIYENRYENNKEILCKLLLHCPLKFVLPSFPIIILYSLSLNDSILFSEASSSNLKNIIKNNKIISVLVGFNFLSTYCNETKILSIKKIITENEENEKNERWNKTIVNNTLIIIYIIRIIYKILFDTDDILEIIPTNNIKDLLLNIQPLKKNILQVFLGWTLISYLADTTEIYKNDKTFASLFAKNMEEVDNGKIFWKCFFHLPSKFIILPLIIIILFSPGFTPSISNIFKNSNFLNIFGNMIKNNKIISTLIGISFISALINESSYIYINKKRFSPEETTTKKITYYLIHGINHELENYFYLISILTYILIIKKNI